MPDQPTDPGQLRDRLAEDAALRLNGPASDGRGWYRNDAERTQCYMLADAVLVVVQPLLDAKDTEIEQLRARVAWLAASHSDGLDLIIQLSDERDRLAAEVRGLEETVAGQQQNALHWQERAEAADGMLDQASDEIERLNTELAGIDQHQEIP